MRKLLVFLALAALGAGLLFWIDSRTARETPEPAPSTQPAPPVQEPPETGRGVLTEVRGSSGKGGQVALSGPLDVWTNDNSLPGNPRKRSHLVAGDCLTLGDGTVELRDAELELFDPASGEREALANAELARARMRLEPTPQLDDQYPLTLRDTVVTYQTGSRFAPVTLRVPTLETLVALERATSDEALEIEGRGLRASGAGLVVERKSESVTIQRNPQATVELQDGSSAALSSRGALVLRSRPDLGEEMAEIEARDGARLVLGGEQALAIDADLVRLFGRIERGADSRFRPTRGEAEGHVVVQPTEGLARGERLVLEFDPAGRPAHIALDGRPELELVLRGTRLADVPPELLREGESLTVLLDGAGPLELFVDRTQRFLFTGPAKLRLPAVGATLECDGSISGQYSKGTDELAHALIAEGNVRLDYEQISLRSPLVSLRSFLDAQSRPAARVDSGDATTIRGTLTDGRLFSISAAGGLAIERTRDGFYVPEAREVSLALGGERAWTARADLVRDLDAERATFVAEGDVQVESSLGHGRGERFEARSMQAGELSGTLETPARFDSADGWFEAQFVDVQPSLVDARGRAHAWVGHAGLTHEVRAGWVVAQRQAQLEGQRATADLLLDAGEQVQVTRVDGAEQLELRARRFHAEAGEELLPDGKSRAVPQLAIALGEVSFSLAGAEARYAGRGERLELRADRSGRLETAPGAKVALNGQLGQRGENFDLQADRVDFSPERVVASGFEIEIDGLETGLSRDADDPRARRVRAIGGLLAADRSQITLSQGVYIGGLTRSLEPWSLDAELVLLRARGPLGAEGGEPALASLQDLVAEGSVQAQVVEMGRARARLMTVGYDSRRISLFGDPDSPPEREVVLERTGVTWRSPSFTFDLNTGFLQSEAGRIESDPDAPESWSLSYDAIEPLPIDERTLLIFRQPVWQDGETQLRANWALLWVDQAEWRKLSSDAQAAPPLVEDPDAPRTRRLPGRMFGPFPLREASGWLHELYLDGDVEYRINDVRKARAEGVYVDLVEGHGWVHDFVIDIDLPIGSRDYKLKVKAAWLRSSLDGALRASDAVATTCAHDVPHYVIKIKNFGVAPRYVTKERTNRRTGELEQTSELDGWNLEMSGNEIAFVGGLGLPLPRIAGPMNEKYELDREAISVGSVRLPSFGSDSKFGTFVSTSFASDIGWIGKGFHWLLNQFAGPDVEFPKLEGRTQTHVDVNNRGLALGVESLFQAEGRYRWAVYLDTIYDTGDDRGLVRVDESDRSTGRAWFHTRGRYFLGPEEWLDAVLTYQTDPGVQAEYFEGDYLAYEERETFVHWRRVEEETFWSATLEARLEDFRTQIVDQPALTWARGRSEIGHIGDLPVVQSANVTLDHLARFEGDPQYEDPFPDGLGDREMLRLDVTERVELPWTPGFLGLRVTPYLEARATGWDQNAAEDSVAGRGALIAGLQASTSLWRSFDDGSRHMLTPAINVHGDVASGDSGLPVVQFDTTDKSIEGRYIDFSLRSRWENRELTSDLDAELTQSWAESVGPGLAEGWLPLATRISWLSTLSGIPYGISHDGRYDTDSGETDYSRTFFGVEPFTGLDLETGYHTGRDITGDRLFNALSVGARYAFSPKWELEGRQTFNVGEANDRLAYAINLRRFGHDFVVEISNSFVAGEGANSLHFSITPIFTWRRSDQSQIDRWRALRR